MRTKIRRVSRLYRRGLVAVFVTLAAFVLAGTADAATARVVETGGPDDPRLQLLYDAAPGEMNVLTVSVDAGGVTLTDPGAVITAGAGCVAVDEHEVRCAADSVHAELGDGNDTATAVSTLATSFFVSFWGQEGNDDLSVCPECRGFLSGGEGADHLVGGNVGNTLVGWTGNDLIQGGAASDWIIGDAGADTLTGGDGNDTFLPARGWDRVDGGSGTDTLRYAPAARPMVVDLGFGLALGDGPDLITDVENVTGSDFADVIRGNTQANRLAGGPGGDILRGRAGKDTLVGGPGRDTLYARDGEQDGVSGGRHRDRARVDQGLDVVRLVEALF